MLNFLLKVIIADIKKSGEGADMNVNCAHKLLKIFSIPGEPFEFGCKETEARKFARLARENYPEQNVCIVSSWVIVDFKSNKRRAPPCETRLYAGCVELDFASRFAHGRRILTTPMITISTPPLFITSNTAYILVGEGSRKAINARKICAGTF
ncbi:hypothetical protein CBP51_03220 [Cellvibrio mixtus]|uniref:DUF6957 domain-containing protein n=1 Tax=Cellvibrio mixtus TaxID=39650 RepID=A0A266Q8W3_9GAMM|nr:hypothetical protein [Cellvibrio mixtus]OZY86056.1 hypothetical protein CBP51_03220 [Cellvibrio mixtus]